MENILSIDISTNPGTAVVAEVNGRTIRILESHNFANTEFFSREQLLKVSTDLAMATENQENPVSADQVLPSEQSAASTSLAMTQNGNGASGHDYQELKNLLKSIQSPWASSILIVPTYDYLSLNLELPFNDQKQINKVIDLEVQDLVPFEVSEFTLHHKVVNTLASGSYDVHVSIMPKVCIRRILQICRSNGYEPPIVSTAASVLGGIYFVASDYLAPTSATICVHDPFYYLILCIDGELRADRIIDRRVFTSSKSQEEFLAHALTEFKLTLSAAETRYERTIERIYVIGSEHNHDLMQQTLGRSIEILKLSELIKSEKEEPSLASLGAVFAQDTEPPPILTNFRTREFSYSPQLTELFAGIKLLIPYILGLTMLFIIGMICSYYIREYQIGRVERAIRKQINNVLTRVELPYGEELKVLEAENYKLTDQLEDLGSPSTLTPLDGLLEVSRDFSTLPSISVTKLNIKGIKIRIEGSAPDYAAVEQLEKTLRKKKTVYCGVKKETSSSAGLGSANTRGFTFELRLCE